MCIPPFLLAADVGEIHLFETMEALTRYVEVDDLPLLAYDSNARLIELSVERPPRWYELGQGRVVAIPTERRDEGAVNAILISASESYADAGLAIPVSGENASLRERLLDWARVAGIHR